MAQGRRPAQERHAAQARRAAPRAADVRRISARPAQTGTDAATRPAARVARTGLIRRDAERSRDARSVTEQRVDSGTRGAQPPSERRWRPASTEDHRTGGAPTVSGEARASGRPAPTHNLGRADGRTPDSGRPQPPSRPAARRTRTARPSYDICEIVSATLRRARAALRGPFAGQQGAMLAAVRAVLAGRNPVVAAIKAWFAGLSTPVKILMIVGLALLALLAPLLLLLVALAVAVVVISVRTPAAS
jgi:hypothetical protein